jgi:hypothetical protein
MILIRTIVVYQMATYTLTNLTTEKTGPLPVLLVPELPRHTPNLPYDKTQCYVTRHTRSSLWTGIPSRV